MVQPLGLNATQMKAYIATLSSSHDFAISLDILKLDHTAVRSVTTHTLDGQINLQQDGPVQRTASFTFDDPDHSFHLDADSPWEGAVFVDRMVQVRHTVTVPGVGEVTAIPFVGPISKLSRDGDTISVECQDKTSLAVKGCQPVTAKKGSNAVAAIRHLMRDGAGETRFRLPTQNKRQLHKAFSCGWAEDASPWAVCSRIADQLNMQLVYACDGYLLLRPWPSSIALTADGGVLTSPVDVDFDIGAVSNYVRVTGTLAAKKKKTTKAGAKPSLETPPAKVTAQAVAAPSHPMAPARLGRNGVGRYLPTLIDGATYKSAKQARDLASKTLSQSLPMTTGVSFDMLPFFHLDVGDNIVAQAPSGRVVVRLYEGSIPLAISGDMSVGVQKRVSGGHGRLRVGVVHPHATKKQRRQYHKDLKAWRKSHKGKH